YKELSEKYRFSEEDINADYKINGEIITGLAQIITELNKEIARLKTEKNGLGFSDAEQLAVKLLSVRTEKGIEPSQLAKELSEYYKVIMIDEFQDANDTQNLIFRLLSHNGTAESNGDNLFEVGDVKQSIYRFRLANPKIFTDALTAAEPYSKDYTGKNAYVLLNKNFRSSSDVVEFVNDTFSCLMSKRNGGTDYTSAEQLELGAEYPEADRGTEFIFAKELEADAEQSSTPVDSDNEEDSSDELTLAEINAEAYAAAEKIKSMLGKVTVTEKGVQRPCECRDFCILLRDRARGQLYADALAAQGIKAYCEETAGYLGSREISVLINLLTIIDNPMKDIPLVSVLMSPMFMLTADEAAELRIISKDPYDRIYKSVTAVLDEENPAPFSAREKLERFMKIYKKLRICAASQSLERLIRTIYDSTDFLASVQAYADGEQKKANLRLLLEYAKSYEQNSEGGLSGFLRYLNDISEKGGDFVRASVVSPAANIVSIKTIHKSKGLEYPFVFLCGSTKLFNLTDTYASMQVNLDYGAGFRIQKRETLQSYSSFPQYVIGSINRSETVSEEMRLLYVALTRAKEKLFITIPKDEKTDNRIAAICTNLVTYGGITEDMTAEARSMQDWLLQVLLTHPEGEKLQSDFDLPERKSSCRIKIS
ncbi:MAG: 3'-5' exonuclease, partial [Huintestinicola sp.]